MDEVSYKPAPLVVKTLVSPVSLFVTMTVTPGSSAPVESVTVPRMSPEFVACAWAMPTPSVHAKHRAIALTVERINLIVPPKDYGCFYIAIVFSKDKRLSLIRRRYCPSLISTVKQGDSARYVFNEG